MNRARSSDIVKRQKPAPSPRPRRFASPSRRAWRYAWLLLAAALLLVTGGAAWIALQLQRPVYAGTDALAVRIAPGASTRAIARSFIAAGAQLDPDLFAAAATLNGTARQLRAGQYAVDPGMTLLELLRRLRRGDVMRERLTVVEGWTLRDLRASLDANPDLRHDTQGLGEAELLRAVGASEARAEGLFAPDTYLFDPGSSDLDFLRRAYKAQSERLQQAWNRRAADLPYREPYEALIMASLVEKETGRPDERGRIAGVFVNRQRRGMLLQTDPAVVYGLGDRYDGRLHKRDLMTDTPYNTYTRAGLPPTPIALPGRAAIDAALAPEATQAIYFVARGDGTTKFSDTLEQHNQAVDRYRRGGNP